MFNHQVFAFKALKGGWYVLGPVVSFLVLLAFSYYEDIDLVILLTLLVMIVVSLIIWIIQDKQIAGARKQASYEAWDSLRRHELSDQIRKIVKDYKKDHKYYNAQLKRFFSLAGYAIALAGSAGFSAEAIETDFEVLVEQIEDKLNFKKFENINDLDHRVYTVKVQVYNGGEYFIILIGRTYDPRD